ncbi:hypothetical protein HPB49_014563 [Dermacentor silvarum]|uniref:Uncharacterized protein n=1 Tax=Dermacentor silvarum TaxID=543639 RepID=A0ACB8DJT8_DERSI|nr:hypothetical protein HPB49_014563 [Dermacentor silvarum]
MRWLFAVADVDMESQTMRLTCRMTIFGGIFLSRRKRRSGASDGTVGGAEGVVRAALLCHREQASVGSEETIGTRRSGVAVDWERAVVNAEVRNKCDHFPKTSKEKAAVKERFLRRGAIPGVIGCMDGSLIAIIAPKGERMAAFMCRKGYYAEICMFVALMNAHFIRSHLPHICDADMWILTVYPMRTGLDHDSFVWRTTWLRRRFQAGCIANPGEYLFGDSGYPLDSWLLTPVTGHLPMRTA